MANIPFINRVDCRILFASFTGLFLHCYMMLIAPNSPISPSPYMMMKECTCLRLRGSDPLFHPTNFVSVGSARFFFKFCFLCCSNCYPRWQLFECFCKGRGFIRGLRLRSKCLLLDGLRDGLLDCLFFGSSDASA